MCIFPKCLILSWNFARKKMIMMQVKRIQNQLSRSCTDLLSYNNHYRWMGGELKQRLLSLWDMEGTSVLFLLISDLMKTINWSFGTNLSNLSIKFLVFYSYFEKLTDDRTLRRGRERFVHIDTPYPLKRCGSEYKCEKIPTHNAKQYRDQESMEWTPRLVWNAFLKYVYTWHAKS